MRELISSIIHIEKFAADVYEKAAKFFNADMFLSDFLNQLAADERGHAELVEKALACLTDSDVPADVILGAETISKIERPLVAIQEGIGLGAMTKEDLIHNVIEAEFSEWNPLFLYVVQFVHKNRRDCLGALADIQRHERQIRHFLHSMPDPRRYLERFTHFPVAWRERVLIVDDDPLIVNLLKNILEIDEWNVETTFRGKDALARLENEYFDVIVSDMEMPEMNGIDFFKEAEKIWPEIGARFLFYAGDISSEHRDFFQRNGIRYMLKPAPVKEIRENISRISHQKQVK
jgi:CheY-like chemotaxis protein